MITYANHLHSEGSDVTIFTNDVDTVFEVAAKISPISARKSRLATVVSAVTTTYNYDIVIADIIMIICLLSLRNRKRLVYLAQDYDEAYYGNIMMKLLVRMAYYLCLSLLRIPVIAVSDHLANTLRKRFNASVSVVPNGIDRQVYFPDREETLLRMKGNRKAILLFSRSDYRKGFDLAMQALLPFKHDIDAGRILIWTIGEKIPLPFEAHLFGNVSEKQVRNILSCSDILLYPSRHEGMGMLVLEALSCGCSVITTEAVKFVTNDRDAIVCAVNDLACIIAAIEILLSDDQKRMQLIENGFRTADKYSLQESKDMLGRVLRSLVI